MKLKILIIIIAIFVQSDYLEAASVYSVLGLYGRANKIITITVNKTEYISLSNASKFFSVNYTLTDDNTTFQSGIYSCHFLPGSFYLTFKQSAKTKVLQMSKPALRIGKELCIPLDDFLRCMKSTNLFLISVRKSNISFLGLVSSKPKEEVKLKRIKSLVTEKKSVLQKIPSKLITRPKVDETELLNKIDTKESFVKRLPAKLPDKQTVRNTPKTELKIEQKKSDIPPDYKPDMYILPAGLIRHEVDDSFNKKRR